MVIKLDRTTLLPLYRTFIFRWVKFECLSNDKQDQMIVKALNIKNRKERITYIYDSACLLVDNYYNNENICGFKHNQCYVQRRKKLNLINGCCRCCRYSTSRGCSTKNLTCKLFVCSEVCKRRKVITYEDLKILKVLSFRQQILIKSDYFSLREDVLKDLYSYSIIYAGLRILFRLLKNTIILKRKNDENG